MSQSAKNVFEKLIDKDLLRKAINNASKDKEGQYHVRKVMDNLDYYVDKLRELLISGEFKPSPYREEIKKCRIKVRLIKKHPFYPDRCIEHAIALVMLPYWNKVVQDCTFASWKGRGILAKKNPHYSLNKRIKKYINSFNGSNDPLYCLRFDIKKCYESVDNDRLKLMVTRYCKDRKVNQIIFDFIDSCKGLPIGSYLSQLLINLYLTALDNFIMYKLYLSKYVRYMDDGSIFSQDKAELQTAKYRIMNFLWYQLGLELNGKRQVFPIGKDRKGRSLDLGGFCYYRGFTLLRKRTKLRMKKRRNNPKSMASYKGLLLGCDSFNLIKSMGYVNIHELGH